MPEEVEEALRSAQELCSYLWNRVTTEEDVAGIEISADQATAATFCALLNDARERVENALDAIELSK